MKVTLISIDDELYCIGVRILSTCLRKAGHQVQTLFLPQKVQEREGRQQLQTTYSQKLLERVWQICNDSDLIGISLMTNNFHRALNITEYLKKHNVSAPIMWGGVHPTVAPEMCLEYADIVCVGEGEDALVELVNHMENGRPYFDTKNMWFKKSQDIIRNPLRPLIQNLDEIPFPDYSGMDHFLAIDEDLEQLTTERLKQFVGKRFAYRREGLTYPVMTSRGCPHSCAYCCNSVYARLYPNQKRVRFRSATNVIDEINIIIKMFGRPGFIAFLDDNFTTQNEGNLRSFCERYHKEIGIPFFCQCDPFINENKMKILIAGGCAKIAMGVESASERIATLYNRGKFHDALPKAIALIESYRSQMSLPPSYQFIIDNPNETVEDTLKTLRLAVGLKKPWDNPIYSLFLFPGTELYEIAIKKGDILNKDAQIYGRDWHEHSNPFFKFWIRLYRANLPRFFLRLLLIPVIARFLASDHLKPIWRGRLFR